MKRYFFRPNAGRWLAAVTLGSALLVTSGCIARGTVGAQGAGATWYSGRLESNLGANLDEVFRASEKAIAELQFAKVSDRKSTIDAQLISRTAVDKKVSIVLNQVTEDSTKVSIRVGLMGDQALSQAILEKIKANL
jgi:hypothetical protein